ncbi:MAG: hypothetical protein ACR2NN_24290 [Bryobacteraceae bacterium]
MNPQIAKLQISIVLCSSLYAQQARHSYLNTALGALKWIDDTQVGTCSSGV